MTSCFHITHQVTSAVLERLVHYVVISKIIQKLSIDFLSNFGQRFTFVQERLDFLAMVSQKIKAVSFLIIFILQT